MSDKPAEYPRRHLRLLHGRRDDADDDGRRHDANLFRIEQEILAELNEVKLGDVVAFATRLVAERLVPIDGHAAEIFLAEIERGELP